MDGVLNHRLFFRKVELLHYQLLRLRVIIKPLTYGNLKPILIR